MIHRRADVPISGRLTHSDLLPVWRERWGAMTVEAIGQFVTAIMGLMIASGGD